MHNPPIWAKCSIGFIGVMAIACILITIYGIGYAILNAPLETFLWGIVTLVVIGVSYIIGDWVLKEDNEKAK